MAEVVRTLEIGAPADAVWTMIADFAAVEQYLPMVARCDLEGDDGPGQLRHLSLADGTVTTSRLVACDDAALAMTYEIVITKLPLRDYSSTMQVKAVGPGRCEVTWSSRFEPRGAPLEKARRLLIASLDAGLEGLRKLHEGA